MRITVVLLAPVFLGASVLLAQGTRGPERLLPDRGVVLRPSAFMNGRVRSCTIAVPSTSESWIPTPDQLREIDSLLVLVIDTAVMISARPLPKGVTLPAGATPLLISDYYRQYVGIVTNGRRLVFINGFHKAHFDLLQLEDSLDQVRGKPTKRFDWHTTAVEVCDGGPWYFAAMYDPTSKVIIEFAYNGVG